tara:strand:- start:4569 stop:5174 length:606 start_codon:yes stop_codon:yes gene_type:complete
MEDDQNIYQLVNGTLKVVDIDTGDTVGESGKWVKPLIHPKYNIGISEQICHLVRNGKTYAEVVEEIGLNSVQTIYYWRNHYPDFAEDLRLARRDRGDYYHDKVMSVANNESISKEEVPALKLKADLYKWGAEKANPQEYGNQTKITGDANAPLQIVVDTGIKREEDESIDGELATKEVEMEVEEPSHSDNDGEEKGDSADI